MEAQSKRVKGRFLNCEQRKNEGSCHRSTNFIRAKVYPSSDGQIWYLDLSKQSSRCLTRPQDAVVPPKYHNSSLEVSTPARTARMKKLEICSSLKAYSFEISVHNVDDCPHHFSYSPRRSDQQCINYMSLIKSSLKLTYFCESLCTLKFPVRAGGGGCFGCL